MIAMRTKRCFWLSRKAQVLEGLLLRVAIATEPFQRARTIASVHAAQWQGFWSRDSLSLITSVGEGLQVASSAGGMFNVAGLVAVSEREHEKLEVDSSNGVGCQACYLLRDLAALTPEDSLK